MYANLKVQPLPGAEVRPDPGTITEREFARAAAAVDRDGVLYAHEVEILADGRVRVALDDSDGSEGNEDVHAGYVTIRGGARIVADF